MNNIKISVPQWDFGLRIWRWAGKMGWAVAAGWPDLALLLFTLGLPGASQGTLGPGMCCGVEDLLKTASTVVRPAYFRLK